MKAPRASKPPIPTDPAEEPRPPENAPGEADGEAAESPPAPEPWTAERVLEWNRYYDLYVAGGVLLLIFLVACHKVANSSIWPQVQAGRRMLETGRPLLRDTFSYTMDGQPWINISWLFQVAYAALLSIGSALNTTDPEQALKLGASAMILATAAARVLTGLTLLSIRRPGPGLWWAALCVALALGVELGPLAFGGVEATASGLMRLPTLGGIARVPQISSEVWGLLFLAIELLILFRAIDQGRRGALNWLIPLFLVWANVDESFLFGLIAPGVAAIGQGASAGPGVGLVRLGRPAADLRARAVAPVRLSRRLCADLHGESVHV